MWWLAALRVPLGAQHTKAIISGAWSYDNILALGSEDFTLTLSKPSGDTMEHTNLKSKAVDIQFAVQKKDRGDERESKVRALEALDAAAPRPAAQRQEANVG